MKHTASSEQTVSSKLDMARTLVLPSREAMLQRAPSVERFWYEHKQLLSDAWAEWEVSQRSGLFKPDDSLLDPTFREAVKAAWNDPTKENAVEKCWTEVSPGVFQCQFFDPERLGDLRKYLDDIQEANIPLRPPHGIALNRFGAMLDKRSEGFLAAPGFQDFYSQLLDQYMRPVSRQLFPEIVGYDTQTFGFSIQYEPGIDTSLQLHSDASAVTLNVNLNLPGESFSGSEVDFYDPDSGKVRRLTFTSGMAMLHRGSIPHAAQPITGGKRTNFVLWLYGDRMQVPSDGGSQATTISAQERWTVPSTAKDAFAPF